MNITSFKFPKKKMSATQMKMLQNPVTDRKNKVAENKLNENIQALETEYERFGAIYSRERVSLKHELRGMREELERPTHELLDSPDLDPIERLMSPAPRLRSPRPMSRAQSHQKTKIPEITVEEPEEEEAQTRVPGRRLLPGSSKEERTIEQRMNNIHKRFSLQANSKNSIQELQRKHQMTQKSAKGKRISSS